MVFCIVRLIVIVTCVSAPGCSLGQFTLYEFALTSLYLEDNTLSEFSTD